MPHRRGSGVDDIYARPMHPYTTVAQADLKLRGEVQESAFDGVTLICCNDRPIAYRSLSVSNRAVPEENPTLERMEHKP